MLRRQNLQTAFTVRRVVACSHIRSVLALRALDHALLHKFGIVEGGEEGLHLSVDLVVLRLRGCGAAGVNPDAREPGVVVAPVVDGVGAVVRVDDPHVGTIHVGLGVHNLALAISLARAWSVKADTRGHAGAEENSLERVVDREVRARNRVVVGGDAVIELGLIRVQAHLLHVPGALVVIHVEVDGCRGGHRCTGGGRAYSWSKFLQFKIIRIILALDTTYVIRPLIATCLEIVTRMLAKT